MTSLTEGRISRNSAASALTAVILLGLTVPMAALVASSGASAALNSVQVTIQTTGNLPYQ